MRRIVAEPHEFNAEFRNKILISISLSAASTISEYRLHLSRLTVSHEVEPTETHRVRVNQR